MIPISSLFIVGNALFAVNIRRQKTLLGKKQQHQPVKSGEGVSQQSHATSPAINIKRLLRDTVDALLFTDRQQLQAAMDPVSQKVREEERQKGTRQIQLSLGAVGVASLASFYPKLTPAAVLAVLYLMQDSFKLVWKDFKNGHYLSLYLIGTIVTLGMLLTGELILAAFVGLMEGFFARIINQLEDSSQGRLVNVFSSYPEQVWVVQGGVELQVSFHDLQVGDQVRVNAGEVMPVDGRIMEGFGQVDQHILTGESQPVDKEVGDKVFASTLLLSGRLTVEVLTAGEDTVAAKIGHVLNETQSYKDTVILRGRKIADNFIPVKLGLAAATLPLLGPNAGLAVMLADLGGGLGIASAMSVTTYLQILARQQILVKDGRIFESLPAVDTVVFDKTGTLTQEEPTLSSIHAVGEFTEREVLRFAAAAEYRQPHPVARAILARAEAEQLDLPALEETSYEVGYGIKVAIEGQIIRVGSARFLQREDIALPGSLLDIRQQAEADSHSLIYVAVDDQLVGLLEMEPTIRPEAREMVQVLKQRGMDVYIISGDHEAPTRSLAMKLGVEHYFAETLPEKKADMVQQLRDEGRFVCFVGDGINDAIALKAAQVSVSLKGASTVATDTAQIIFMDGTLKNLLPLFELVDEFEDTMRRNMLVGFAPGVLTIGGVFFLRFGLVTSILILYSSIFGELFNIFWPLAKHQEQLLEPSQENEGETRDIEKPLEES